MAEGYAAPVIVVLYDRAFVTGTFGAFRSVAASTQVGATWLILLGLLWAGNSIAAD
jgi:hypothetical protein